MASLEIVSRSATPEEVLEVEITACRQRMLWAGDVRIRRIYADAMAQLIALRSPETVARMEHGMGIN